MYSRIAGLPKRRPVTMVEPGKTHVIVPACRSPIPPTYS